MRKSFFVPLIGIILFLNVSSVHGADSKLILGNESDAAQISRQQLKAQIQYFQEALDKLGASSPEQTAKMWAEGPKTRNGVLQYAVACEDLKAAIIKKLGKPEESFWNIGASSPWVERYEVGNFKKISPSKYVTTIKYYWATSTGPAGTTEDTLTIVQKNNIWCVSEVKYINSFSKSLFKREKS